MNPAYEKLLKYDSYKAKIDFTPKVALILGSGLGDYADDIRVVDTLDYHDIEGFPVSTVPGHKGRFIFGYVDDVPVVCMQGRVHYYEGYEMSDVVLPTRLMKMMGAEVLFLTNARPRWHPAWHACRGFHADQRPDCKFCAITRSVEPTLRTWCGGYEPDL